MNRICKKCTLEKPIIEFYKHSMGYRHTCKSCTKSAATAWAKENKTARNIIVTKSRHKTSVWQKYANEYKQRTGEVAKRRASKDKRTPNWLSSADTKQISTYYTLAQRLTKCIGIRFVVDHILPLRGTTISGLHVPANLQVISEPANLRKSNKCL